MPALVFARRAVDGDELARVRKLAAARHAPADWVLRARIVALSWSGLTVPQIAEQVGCHPRTVRQRLHRFNCDGVPGLGDREGRGRRPMVRIPSRLVGRSGYGCQSGRTSP